MRADDEDGGLGDVSAALPAALRASGVDAMTLLPGYPAVLDHVGRAREAARLTLLGFQCRLLRADPLIVLDCPPLYERDGGPTTGPTGATGMTTRSASGCSPAPPRFLGGARNPLDWRAQIVHCHDWPAGLAPFYLRGEPEPAASVMTIHNLAFQGNYDAQLLASLELPPSAFTIDGVEFLRPALVPQRAASRARTP
jgi:starch synthase